MLTVKQIEAAKPADKPYKLSDGGGLVLIVNPNGSKLFRLRYSFRNTEKMISLGSFPDTSLADARIKTGDCRKLLSQDIDPSSQRKEAKATAGGNSFGEIAEEYLRRLKDQGRAQITIDKNRWWLMDLAAPINRKPIRQVTAADVLALLQKVEKRGHNETALRLRGAIGAVFRLAVSTLRAEIDPTFALKGAIAQGQVKHRAAITDEVEFGKLWAAIDTYTVKPPKGGRGSNTPRSPLLQAALKFAALTMTRPVEVRLMTPGEVNFMRSVWTIPGARMKMRRQFEIPLSRQALAVLRSIWDPQRPFVFGDLSENAMNDALATLGYKGRQTAHGFKASASTILNERKFDYDTIELCLSHEPADPVRAAYNRSRLWNGRVALMQSYADLLDSFKTQALAA